MIQAVYQGMENTPKQERRGAFAVWQERIAPVFDVSQQVLLVDLNDGEVVAEVRRPLSQTWPEERAQHLAQLGIDVLICGAISRALQTLVTTKGIEVIPFVTGPLDDVVSAWQHGGLNLQRFTMPGCGRRGQRRRAGCRWSPRAAGPKGVCVCPQCGHQEPHVQGQPCTQKRCEKCGVALQRQ